MECLVAMEGKDPRGYLCDNHPRRERRIPRMNSSAASPPGAHARLALTSPAGTAPRRPRTAGRDRRHHRDLSPGGTWGGVAQVHDPGFDIGGDDVPVTPPGQPSAQALADSTRFFAHELRRTTRYAPDITALTTAPLPGRHRRHLDRPDHVPDLDRSGRPARHPAHRVPRRPRRLPQPLPGVRHHAAKALAGVPGPGER
jgi:hypothetical protein